MNRYARIAAIVLGAFALGAVAIVGWSAVVAEAVDLQDRMRRARCEWVDPLQVSVAGHALSLAASPTTTVHTGDRWLSGEEVTGYRSETRIYGFCLDTAPSGPLPVRAVTFALEPEGALAGRFELPPDGGQWLEIAEAGMFLPAAPPARGTAATMVVFDRDPDHGWPRMVSEGVGRDGLRTGAVCRDGRDGAWICDVSVLDAPAGLSYRFAWLLVSAEALAAEALPVPFRRAAEAMREVLAALKEDAVAQR